MSRSTRMVERRRVVVTGMGILCPTGNSVLEAWKNVAAGVSGIGPITRFDASGFEVRIAGEVKGFDPKVRFGHREARRMDRVTQFALAAAQEAIADSGLNLDNEDRYSIGVIVGSGASGIGTIVEGVMTTVEKGPQSVSPLLIPMMIADSPSARIAMEFNLRGPNMALVTACATGNNVIGESAEMIRYGRAEVMVAGGTEAGLLPLAIGSLNNMTALSRNNDDPPGASRPFDKNRDGFVFSEGAAVLILESLDHATARGAHIYSEIVGYGTTDDAFHITAPREDGSAAAVAIYKALADAELDLADIHYINAHGTATPLNDASETKAIKNVWGEMAYDIPISSTKSSTGHLLGAAGSAEAVFSIQAIHDQFIPPTINLHTPDPNCDLNYTPLKGVSASLTNVMSTSLGFGGHNAVLIFSKYKFD
jgi:3-oxoacyl-[acyl-carrier-protein] synthase II